MRQSLVEWHGPLTRGLSLSNFSPHLCRVRQKFLDEGFSSLFFIVSNVEKQEVCELFSHFHASHAKLILAHHIEQWYHRTVVKTGGALNNRRAACIIRAPRTSQFRVRAMF